MGVQRFIQTSLENPDNFRSTMTIQFEILVELQLLKSGFRVNQNSY